MKSLEIAANRASAEAEGGGEALSDLKEKFTAAETKADEMQRKVKELEAENGMLSTDLEASETKYDEVKDELDALTKELEDM